MFRKLVANYFVIVGSGLPNLAITSSTVFLLTFNAGVFPLFAYLAGQVFSATYSNLWLMLTKSNFQVGRWKYRFSHSDS